MAALLCLPLMAYNDHRGHNLDSLERVVARWTPDAVDRASEEELVGLNRAYRDLMLGYQQLNGDKTLFYAHKALEISRKQGWNAANADASRYIGQYYYGHEQYDSALVYFHHSLQYIDLMAAGSTSPTQPDGYSESDVDDQRSALYGAIGNLYNVMEDIPQAMEYYRKAGELFEKHGWNHSNSILHYNMGETWVDEGQFRKARKEYDKAMDFALASGDSLMMVNVWKGYGRLFMEQGRTGKSLKYLKKADSYYDTHAIAESGSRTENLDYMKVVLSRQKRQLGMLTGILTGLVLVAMGFLLHRRKKRKVPSRQAAAKVAEAPQLSAREKEILDLLAKGYTSAQIAECLHLSPETIKWYRKKLLVKFDVANVAELVVKARDAGITLALALLLFLPACRKGDPPQLPLDEEIELSAVITDTVYYEEPKMVAFNFEYPSTDPFGRRVMLSGAFTIDSEITKKGVANGIALLNHYTTFRADECPSRGDLTIQKMADGSGFVTVSADYYGFGSTQDRMQAYCLASSNAQASVDALIWAKKLLEDIGITFRKGREDILYNIGYSEGGQTAIGVIKVLAEQHPEIQITCTYAGAGPYDIQATYRHFLDAGQSAYPSTVAYVLLAYNEFYSLGIPREKMFKEPFLSDIDEWLLSMRHTGGEIDHHIGNVPLSTFIADEMMDPDSEPVTKLMAAFEQENLCGGWTPAATEKIKLFHHVKDDVVPYVCTENLYAYLKDQLKLDGVTLFSNSGETINHKGYHEYGAVAFATELGKDLVKDLASYGIVWVPLFL